MTSEEWWNQNRHFIPQKTLLHGSSGGQAGGFS
jgi:hypothetical protein